MSQILAPPPAAPDDAAIAVRHLARDGFDLVAGAAMRRIVEAAGGSDWDG